MKALFLDIDGVLNSQDFFINRWEDKNYDHNAISADIDPLTVENLNYLLDNLEGYSIILSSSWRVLGLDRTNKALQDKGFKHTIYYKTLRLSYRNGNLSRGDEIMDFVRKFQVEEFLVLDDESFNYEHTIPHNLFFKTSFYEKGLTREICRDIINFVRTKERKTKVGLFKKAVASE